MESPAEAARRLVDEVVAAARIVLIDAPRSSSLAGALEELAEEHADTEGDPGIFLASSLLADLLDTE